LRKRKKRSTRRPAPVSILHRDISGRVAELLCTACNYAQVIRVSRLDKGLSGAEVWLVDWDVQYGVRSKLHVMKLGDYKKLQWEAQRAKQYVAPVSPTDGHIEVFGPVKLKTRNIGILRQEFINHEADGDSLSLKQWINAIVPKSHDMDSRPSLQKVREKIHDLYVKRMRQWRSDNPKEARRTRTLRAEMKDRLAKAKPHLDALERSVGSAGLKASLQRHRLPSWKEIQRTLEHVLRQSETLRYCLTHGDLHAQNVLIGHGDQLHLIDFAWAGYAWEAIDFLMLECSLKFLVLQEEADIGDLLRIERLLDDKQATLKTDTFKELRKCICGTGLQVIACAIAEVRYLAKSLGAVSDMEQYRRGLLAMTASLSGIPGLHRPHMVHSLAYHSKILKKLAC
jgi:Ternary complex associated domain 9